MQNRECKMQNEKTGLVLSFILPFAFCIPGFALFSPAPPEFGTADLSDRVKEAS
jgi:hypothetical protein